MAWYRCVGGAGGSLKLRTASGSIATFNTNMVEAFKSLKSDINPVQDLHGYSKPWSGGGGKNKAHVTATSQTISGVAYTVATDGKITANGTASGASIIDIGTITLLGGNSYVLSGCPSGGSGSTYALFLRGSGTFTQKIDFGGGISFTVTDTVTTTLSLVVYNGYNASNLKFEPMVRLSNTSADFEPYSNICPISGFNALNVTRTGKNLAHNTATSQTVNGVAYTVATDGRVKANGTASGTSILDLGTITLMGGMTYTLSGCPSGGSGSKYVLFLRGSGSFAQKIDFGDGNQFTVADTVTTTLSIIVYNGYTASDLTFEPMVRLSDTTADYSPYNGQTASVNFGQTVYGGVADVTGGKVTITHKLVTYNGSENWQTSGAQSGKYRIALNEVLDNVVYPTSTSEYLDCICNMFLKSNAENTYRLTEGISYQPNYGLRIYSSAYDTNNITLWKSFLANNPLKVLYKLATPIEIDTTAENLTALSGENNVFSDTNGDTEVKYLYRG